MAYNPYFNGLHAAADAVALSRIVEPHLLLVEVEPLVATNRPNQFVSENTARARATPHTHPHTKTHMSDVSVTVCACGT